MRERSGWSHPSVASTCESRKTSTSAVDAFAAASRARTSPSRTSLLRRRRSRSGRISALTSRTRSGSIGQSDPSSRTTICLRRDGGERSSSERSMRRSTHVASLNSTTTTLACGRTCVRPRLNRREPLTAGGGETAGAGGCSSTRGHPLGRASGSGRSYGSREHSATLKPKRGSMVAVSPASGPPSHALRSRVVLLLPSRRPAAAPARSGTARSGAARPATITA